MTDSGKDEESSASSASPFAGEPVDPMVFRKSQDAPELRAAAALLKAQLPAVPREEAPVATPRQSFGPWTPGAHVAAEDDVRSVHELEEEELPPIQQARNWGKTAITALTFVLPLGVLVGVIYVGSLLAGGF